MKIIDHFKIMYNRYSFHHVKNDGFPLLEFGRLSVHPNMIRLRPHSTAHGSSCRQCVLSAEFFFFSGFEGDSRFRRS